MSIYTNPMKRKRKGVATSLSWVGEPSPALSVMLGDRSLESLRRGALGSCLHVLDGPCLSWSGGSPLQPRNSCPFHTRKNATPPQLQPCNSSATPAATQLQPPRATTGTAQLYSSQLAQQPQRSHFVRLFVTRGLAPLPRPVSSPAPFELHPETSRRGRALSLSLHPPRSGDGGVSFGFMPGKSFPQKEAPLSHEP